MHVRLWMASTVKFGRRVPNIGTCCLQSNQQRSRLDAFSAVVSRIDPESELGQAGRIRNCPLQTTSIEDSSGLVGLQLLWFPSQDHLGKSVFTCVDDGADGVVHEP